MMGQRATRVAVGLLVLGCVSIAREPTAGVHLGRGPAPGPRPARVAVRPTTAVSPSAAEDEGYESRSGAQALRWSGAGRHPQWRGCQHTFQPALTAWIFSSADSPAAPGPSGSG